jgi:hypothetical protein
MSSRLSLLPIATAALLSGCGGGVVIGGTIGCDDQMAALTGRLGFPEQVERRVQGGLHIHTFFYVRTGVAIAFTWGDDLSCDQREFRIAP